MFVPSCLVVLEGIRISPLPASHNEVVESIISGALIRYGGCHCAQLDINYLGKKINEESSSAEIQNDVAIVMTPRAHQCLIKLKQFSLIQAQHRIKCLNVLSSSELLRGKLNLSSW